MRHRFALIITIIASGCASNPEVPDEDYSSLYDGRSQAVFATEFPSDSVAETIARGDQAYRSGELDRALFMYMQAVEKDSTEPDAFYRIGRIHEQRGKFSLAVRAYHHVLSRRPDHAGAHLHLGLVMLELRDLELAEQHLTRAVELNIGSWKAQNALGVIADLNGEHKDAIQFFRNALTDSPDNTSVLNNLGYSLYLADDWAGAEQALMQVLRLDSRHELALRNLALIRTRQGALDEALHLLRQVSTEAQALNDLGYICMLEGRYADASSYFRAAIAASPAYYELAHSNLDRNARMARAAASRPVADTPVTSTRPPQEPEFEPVVIQVKSEPPPAIAQTSPVPEPAPQPAIVQAEPMPEPEPQPAIVQAEPMPEPEPQPAIVQAEPMPEPALDDSIYLKRYVAADILNVRETSDKQSPLLDKIRRGRVVRVLKQQDDWAYILYWKYVNGQVAAREGWVHATYLSETRSNA